MAQGRSKKRLAVGLIVGAIMIIIMVIAAFKTNPDTVQSSFWSLFPPVIAIVLALITKEVYSSLFCGILAGGLLFAGFNFQGTVNHVFNDGFIASLTDSYNMGIIIFLVILGAMVALMNRAGGSRAFGEWAGKHIKTRVGAQLMTVLLGVIIFIDDYFNCLTVGSVMLPVTDKHRVSRAKLSYLIDATAAPVCIIAPISSWAAAVSGFVEGHNGISVFVSAIPYNFYALLTIVFMIVITAMKADYGSMARHEFNAVKKGDLYTTEDRPYATEQDGEVSPKGKVIDLVFPIISLIICCVIGMLWTGGIFEGESVINAFANSDASVGLAVGSFFGLVITLIFYMVRRVINFTQFMECIPRGFKAMVPAILILTFAWTLKGMTDSLGAADYVAGIIAGQAAALKNFLPAIIFLIACLLAFATGTSWGTFGILIPIVVSAFSYDYKLMIIAMSACMAGAVCGDHCSPISDTTIMASAGAQCNHVNHVSTQLPYAITVAAISFVSYIVAGFSRNAILSLVVGVAITFVVLLLMRSRNRKKYGADYEDVPAGIEG